MEKQVTNKKSATQRIEDLERAFMSLYQAADNMARDLTTAKEAIKLLGNKLDAVVKAYNNGGGINDEILTKLMVQNSIDELKARVDDLISKGLLQAQEEITEDSFVVSREIDAEGKVENPRLQFSLSSLSNPEVKQKLLGHKPGDVVDFGEDKLKLEVVETYAIKVPEAPAAEEVAAEAPEAEVHG